MAGYRHCKLTNPIGMLEMNAKTELMKFLDSVGVEVQCALIKLEVDYDDYGEPIYDTVSLRARYTDEDYEAFMSEMGEINYEAGLGGQRLFGNVWFIDGTWAARGEYDGSEWWEYLKCPPIPVDLLQ